MFPVRSLIIKMKKLQKNKSTIKEQCFTLKVYYVLFYVLCIFVYLPVIVMSINTHIYYT